MIGCLVKQMIVVPFVELKEYIYSRFIILIMIVKMMSMTIRSFFVTTAILNIIRTKG